MSRQDVSGGRPVPVEGTELPLWGLEIDPERARDAFRAYAGRDGGQVSACCCGRALVTRHSCAWPGMHFASVMSACGCGSRIERRRQGAKDFLGGMGLGMLAGQLADLKLGELLDTPPPGLDEAVAIAKARLPVLMGVVLVPPALTPEWPAGAGTHRTCARMLCAASACLATSAHRAAARPPIAAPRRWWSLCAGRITRASAASCSTRRPPATRCAC